MEIARKSGLTVFFIGIVALTILSLLGLVYITQLAFSSQKSNGKYCYNLSKTQLNIIKLTVIVWWVNVAWLIMMPIIIKIWDL
jgi:uncharacterized membrane protein